jgi:predicted small secreted protein
MIKKFLFSILAATFLAAGLGSLAGCNTVEGVGMDIQRGGEAISNAADDTRPDYRR